jgi:hypothetical protein
MSNPLVGKYFLGVHDELWLSGIVEVAVDGGHYLVRFDDLVRYAEGRHRGSPLMQAGALAIVALSDMVRAGREHGDDDVPPPWLFFDDLDKRAKYQARLDEPEPDDPAGKPRLVSLQSKHSGTKSKG